MLPRSHPRARAVIGLLLCCSLYAAPVRAQGSANSDRVQARSHFDLGLRLFNQGDSGGALAELLRAHALYPHPVVLFNVVLVYQLLGKPVEAVEAAERLLREPGDLDAARLARVREVVAVERTRIGRIALADCPAGALVELDGVSVDRTPLRAPLRVAAGLHVIGVLAPGYLPVRRAVVVAGGTDVTEAIALEPTERRLAHLRVTTRVPDAELLVDGQLAGRTPLPATLALAPGRHALELRRAGYVPARASIELGEGTTGEVALELAVDAASVARDGGSLVLAISERASTFSIDGSPATGYGYRLRLPAGVHDLRVERAGFQVVARKVHVPARATAAVTVELLPTPETRARYVSHATTQRTWSYVALGAGAAVALGGGGFLLWNDGEKSEKKAAFDRTIADTEPGGRCDDDVGKNDKVCAAERETAFDALDSARKRDAFGWVGVGVGVAAIGLGAYLLLSGDDPERYEPRPESDVFAHTRLELDVVPGRGATARVRGRF